MDAVSTIVSILELCSEIRDYISEVNGASEAMTEYLDRIEFCQFLLRKLEVSPENADRREKWEETLELLKKPGAPLHTLKESLDLVKKKLGAGSSTQSGLRKTIRTLKWPFDKRQVEELIKAINSDITLLEVAVTLDQRSLLMDIERSQKERGETLANMMEHLQHELQTVQTAEHMKTVLNWISETDYGKKQSDLYNLRQSQTGEWLLNSSEFIEWKDSEKRSRTLFCPGMPGAGKTILTSVVVRTLTDQFADDQSVAIAWLYCDFRLKQEQTLNNMLSSLVKQLLVDHTPLPSVVEELYKRNGRRNTRPSTEEFVEALESAVACRLRIFVLVDGLDEYSNGRAQLLNILSRLQKKYPINLFATSRGLPDIVAHFKNDSHLEIRATEQDIKSYLEGFLDSRDEIPLFIQKSQTRRQEIVDTITKATYGMFLLARLYINSIKGMVKCKDLTAALKHIRRQTPKVTNDKTTFNNAEMEKALADAYDDAMQRINDQGTNKKDLAIQTLYWITYAVRPLSIEELQHALAFTDVMDDNDPGFRSEMLEDENLPDIDDVVTVCAGLVTVDEQSHIVRLVHYTTQEYFEKTQSKWFPWGSSLITRACVRYLSVGNLGLHQLQKKEREELQRKAMSDLPFEYQPLLDVLSKSRPLYHYASRNWCLHPDSTSAITEEATDLLQRDEKMFDFRDEHMLDFRISTSEFILGDHSVTALHLVLICRLSDVMMNLAQRVESLDTPDTYGRTPLMYAMSSYSWEFPGDIEALLRALLATKKIDITLKDQKGQTVLSYAVHTQNEAVLRLILEAYLLEDNGALYLDMKDNEGRTPLSIAAETGHGEAVRLLLESNRVDPDSKDSHGRTPLSYAATYGHPQVVKLLLASGQVSVDSKDDEGRTPLSYAAARRRHYIVKLLLASGQVNADSKDDEGRTPLSYAAARGSHDMVKLLLASGQINVDSKDNEGRTPLLHATMNYFSENSELIAKTLIETGQVDLDSKTNNQGTPLLYAARNGFISSVQLLLASSQVDVNHKDNRGHTPLFYANDMARQRYLKKDFQDANVEKNLETCRPIIRLLLNANGVDVNARNNLGYTPLSSAMVADASDFISLLLEDQRVNVNSADDFGETALMRGVEHGVSIPNLKLLLEHPRLDLDLEDQKGRTALSIAIEKNNQEAIRLLREKYAEMGKQLPETEPAAAEGQAETKA